MATEDENKGNSQAGYEFNKEQNLVISNFAVQLKRSGIATLVGGLLFATYIVVQWLKLRSAVPADEMVYFHLDYGIWAVISALLIVTGISLSRADKPFTSIVNTSGNDIDLLVTGVSQLSRILRIVFLVLLPCLTLLLASIVLLAFHGQAK